MAKTGAERQREYRERRNADPERREKYLRSERMRWTKDVLAGKKKGRGDLNKRGQKMRRKGWRKAKERQKQREMAVNTIATPPQSPDRDVVMSHEPTRLGKRLCVCEREREGENRSAK